MARYSPVVLSHIGPDAESVRDKADRYFAEQCERLGPVAGAAPAFALDREAAAAPTPRRTRRRVLEDRPGGPP